MLLYMPRLILVELSNYYVPSMTVYDTYGQLLWSSEISTELYHQLTK